MGSSKSKISSAVADEAGGGGKNTGSVIDKLTEAQLDEFREAFNSFDKVRRFWCQGREGGVWTESVGLAKGLRRARAAEEKIGRHFAARVYSLARLRSLAFCALSHRMAAAASTRRS